MHSNSHKHSNGTIYSTVLNTDLYRDINGASCGIHTEIFDSQINTTLCPCHHDHCLQKARLDGCTTFSATSTNSCRKMGWQFHFKCQGKCPTKLKGCWVSCHWYILILTNSYGETTKTPRIHKRVSAAADGHHNLPHPRLLAVCSHGCTDSRTLVLIVSCHHYT